MAEADEALRRATMARLSEILRTAAMELAGPGASVAEIERALLTLSPVLVEVLQEARSAGLRAPGAGRKIVRRTPR